MIKSTWVPETGWRGLYFGTSTLWDVIGILGEPDNEYKFFDGNVYSFCNEKVQATFLSGSPGLFKLRIASSYDGPEAMPTDIAQAKQLFPGLVEDPPMRSDGHYGKQAKMPGVTVHYDPYADSPNVLWVELSAG